MNKSPLKWAGNKYKLLHHILPHIGSPKRYCEPFGGSLSVALNVYAKEYILNDINRDLYYLYTNITHPFIDEARALFNQENNTRERYNQLKAEFNQTTDPKQRALLFLYLNKHGFNGLSRYNNKGEFNVPYGRECKNKATGVVTIQQSSFPEKELLNFFRFTYTCNVKFFNESFDFPGLYESLESGDVVYFDPPYVPLTTTSNFTQYTKEDFTYENHIQLVELGKSLSSRGIKVIVSNSDTDLTRELYNDAQIHTIQVQRNISAKASSRGKVNELIAIY